VVVSLADTVCWLCSELDHRVWPSAAELLVEQLPENMRNVNLYKRHYEIFEDRVSYYDASLFSLSIASAV